MLTCDKCGKPTDKNYNPCDGDIFCEKCHEEISEILDEIALHAAKRNEIIKLGH